MKGDDGDAKGMIDLFMRIMLDQRRDVSIETLRRLTSGD